jgi:hypothetical protein
MLRRIVWQKFTDVSEALAASIIRAMRSMMAAASTSETSVNFYPTPRRNIPEDSQFHIRRRENLKSHQEIKLLNAQPLTMQDRGTKRTKYEAITLQTT